MEIITVQKNVCGSEIYRLILITVCVLPRRKLIYFNQMIAIQILFLLKF